MAQPRSKNMTTTEIEMLKERITTLQKEFKVQAAKLFAAEAKNVFAAYPTMQSFGWNQYTPYFNDGEQCVFRVNVDYGIFIDMDGEISTDDDTDVWGIRSNMKRGVDWRGNPYTPSERDHAALLISDFIRQFDADMMKSLFGDHVSVRVNADGHIEINEYEHE
jgi:hypothetical protein